MKFIITVILGFFAVALFFLGYLMLLSTETEHKEPAPVLLEEKETKVFDEDNWFLVISTENEPYVINGDSIIYNVVLDSITVEPTGKFMKDETTIYLKVNRKLSVFRTKK